jgi:mycofactocin precursor
MKEGTSMAEITQITHPTNTAAVPEQASTLEDSVPQMPINEEALDEELEEELIIEDFTIDGICGVY